MWHTPRGSVAFSSDKIQAIRERVDIVHVIGTRLALKKQGQRYVGLCPFHTEKTPSFSVSPDKGLYYCFGCHAGGDVFAFVMRHEGLDFHEAARRLGSQVGIELEPESQARAAQRRAEEEIVRVNGYALAFFQHQLWAKAGTAARSYLVERGIPEVVAREWRLGHGGAPGELLAYLDSKRVPRALASKAGLLTDDGSRCLFEGRLVFPVVDPFGRLAGFGGRRLGEGGSSPKYINTRESPVFSKRRLLFGWDHAEAEIRKSRRVILVEGYMDVLACHAAGLGQAVAALGTAFTDEHARQCARLAKEAVLLLDGDAAGRAASYKAAERLLAAHLPPLVVALPDDHDPDSFWRQYGAAALLEIAAMAKPAIEHFLAQAFARADGTLLSVEGRAQAAREIGRLLTALGPGLERDLYLARLAEHVGVPVDQLARHLQAATSAGRTGAGRESDGTQASAANARQSLTGDDEASASRASAPEPGAPVGNKRAEPRADIDRVEIAVLRELLLFPELRPKLETLVEYALSPVARKILEDLATTHEDAAAIVTRHAGGDRRLERLAAVRPANALDEHSEKAARTYEDVLARMKARHVDAALRDVLRELAVVEAQGGEPNELIRKQQDLSRRKKALLRDRHLA